MALLIDLEAARHVEALPLSQPSKTHAAGNNRSDAVPVTTLPIMQSSEFRNRHPQPQSLRNVDQNGESSTSSAIELTPTSSEDSEQAQGTEMTRLCRKWRL
jgi:hypothetical protein